MSLVPARATPATSTAARTVAATAANPVVEGVISGCNDARHHTDLTQRERQRLRSLAAYDLLDKERATMVGADLTDHVTLARLRSGAHFAAVNIIGDTEQQTVAGSDGITLTTTDRVHSICSRILYATGADDVFITSDASRDPDLRDNPWVSGLIASIRFYAGAALIGQEGLPLGMLCVFSTEPLSEWAAQRAGQRLLPVRDSVVAVLEAHRHAGHRLSDLSIDNDDLTDELAHLIAAPHRAPIDAVIDEGTVRTLFQPIVHLDTGTITAFEALTRGPAGTELESPIALLDAARSVGRLGELDWLCRTSAMRAAAGSGLPDGLSWFINVEPAGLESQCPRHLLPILDHARAELRVVLEVVERDVEVHVTRLLRATDKARRDAWGVALDDVGAESGSLALLPFLQPDVVKLDMSLLNKAPSATAADVTAAVRTYAERTGAVILAEGIETLEQEELAKVFGATYGQGYLYGRPAALPALVPAPTHPIPLRQRPAPIQGATPFEVLRETITTQRGRSEHLLHIFDHLHRHCVHADEGTVLFTLFEDQAGFLNYRALFDALAERNALTVCLVPGITTRKADARYHVGPLPPGSRLTGESAMIVVTPHYAGALVTRHTEHTTADGTPLVDYIYTHDRPAIIIAARAYLDQMKPDMIIYPETSAAISDKRHTEQARRARLPDYLTERLHPVPRHGEDGGALPHGHAPEDRHR